MKMFLLLLSLSLPAAAATVVNGGSLLNQVNANQIATWLGEGDLVLTNVYSSSGGLTAPQPPSWHNAVDGVGRTVSLLLTDIGLVGGYNPVSWNSSGGYTINLTDAGRTAFIFNLNSGVIQRQLLGSSDGQYQTYNHVAYGPTFGGGHDLTVNRDGGIFYFGTAFSYGNGTGSANIFGNGGQTNFTLLGFETFTITNVPELSTLAPTSLALLLAAAKRQRHGR